MNIYSWNVNGIRSVFKKGFLNFLSDERPDILCLQEIKSDFEDFPKEIKELKDYHAYIYPADRKGYSGTAVLAKTKPENVIYGLGKKEFDTEGRTIILEYEKYFLINLYFPHGGRSKEDIPFKMKMYETFFGVIGKLSKPLILCGDFNIAHEEIDLARPKNNTNNTMFTKEEREQLDTLVKNGFIDTFRLLNKHSIKYTWWPYRNNLRERNIGWRIDYIFISNNLVSKLSSADIKVEVKGSDHCPITASINI